MSTLTLAEVNAEVLRVYTKQAALVDKLNNTRGKAAREVILNKMLDKSCELSSLIDRRTDLRNGIE